jgi:hypothetical protein
MSSAQDLCTALVSADTNRNDSALRPLVSANNSRVNDMSSEKRKRGCNNGLLFAGVIIASALAASGFSRAGLANSDLQLAQATAPLQSTPGAESKPSGPSEPATTGTDTRPSHVPPQPAHPDPEAEKHGAAPALPPAPAEKIAPPIKD